MLRLSFRTRSQAGGPGHIFGRPLLNPLHGAGQGLDPRIFVRPPRWATPGQGRRSENRQLAQRRKHPGTQMSQPAMSTGLSLRVLDLLISGLCCHLRTRAWGRSGCGWSLCALGQLTSHIKCVHIKCTKLQDNMSIWWGVGKSPKC